MGPRTARPPQLSPSIGIALPRHLQVTATRARLSTAVFYQQRHLV